MSLAELIDGALDGRALVYGSLPPAGRDLDLLVREPQRGQVEERLLTAGFAQRGALLARFASCSVEVVELCDPARWSLAEQELDELFAQAQPIGALRWLVRPSPHHSLLILARRLVGERGVLGEKLRARAAQAIAEDPLAWQRARDRAQGWGASRALDALERAYATDSRAPSALCTQARRELERAARDRRPRTARLGSAGPPRAEPRQAAPGRWRRAARLTPAEIRHAARRRLGTVISFSGLDGSGKSSQAAALRDALERLGCEAVVVRTRISWEEWLWAMVPRVKLLIGPFARAALTAQALARRRRGRGRFEAAQEGAAPGALDAAQDASALDAPSAGAQPSVGRAGDPVGRLREGSELLTDAWIVLIALANAWSQWRLMGRPLLRGSVVICDRYTLDSLVELRCRYGPHRPLRPLRAALARLYPRPARAYYLDVEPHTAFERKREWGLERLSELRALYLQEHAGMGVELLDGERPPDQLCAQVAREVWLNALPR
jgi:thymidylate kinase